MVELHLQVIFVVPQPQETASPAARLPLRRLGGWLGRWLEDQPATIIVGNGEKEKEAGFDIPVATEAGKPIESRGVWSNDQGSTHRSS